MEEHERENDIDWRGYSVLFPNIWKFLALENLPCHEYTDSCHIWVICFKGDSFTLLFSGSKFNNKTLGIKPMVQIQSYEDTPFLVQNGPFVLKNIFSENPLIQLVIFIHIYLLSKKNSDVNPLIKYTLLKNTEILLARNILNVHVTPGPFHCGIF